VPLITATLAKLHLRVDGTTEDDLITIWIATAEQQVAQFLNRNVYADQGTLDAAVTAAPTALATATTAYDAAIVAADAMEEGVDKDAAVKYAEEAYALAQTASDMAQRGMVVNDTVKAALLLAVGNLYENRGDVAADGLPAAARSLLHPYRVGMGV
jgi:hypothetical protein